MAVTTVLWELKYENGNYLELKYQLDGGTIYSIIKLEEQGAIADLLPYAKTMCLTHIESVLDTMTDAMAS